MPGHPSAQNPLMTPISLKVKSTVPTMAHKALTSDPLTPVTSSSMTLVLAYPASGKLFSVLLVQHTRTHLDHIP